MSEETDAVYFRAWGALRRALRLAGVRPAEADKIRRLVHQSITGRDVGRRDLAPVEFSEVTLEFRRRALLVMWITRLARSAGVSTEGTAAYLDAISQRLAGCPFAQLDARASGKLYGLLEAHASRHRDKHTNSAPTSVDQASDITR